MRTYCYSRRKILGNLVGLGSFAFAPRVLSAPTKTGSNGLSFVNLHTGESICTEIGLKTKVLPRELQAVNHLLRDHRSGEIHPIDPALLQLLVYLQAEVGVSGSYQVISGYRSPATNSKLRAKGDGVATRSLHMQGKAVDIRLPGCQLKDLQAAAYSLKRGGVGYYPKSNFIHVDTGRVRYW